MTDKQIVETLAGKVMGWRQITTTKISFGGTIVRRNWWDASLPDPDDDGLWPGYAPHDYPRPTADEKWNPLTDANATLECLERMDSWARIGSKVDVCWKSCKWFRSSCNDFKIDACRAMVAAVEGRDA